jgi:hypothetical protein
MNAKKIKTRKADFGFKKLGFTLPQKVQAAEKR